MYDIIKKQNGEHFAQAIRNYHNGIFDIPDIDKIVKYAGRDAKPILQYLLSIKNKTTEEIYTHHDPIELLNRAGYDAYVADTFEKQNAIQKYFAPGEELCSFYDKDRFKNYYIINVVRKDVNKIKRGDFKNPRREDEYGTSVMSIQVLKSGGFISIKNRYNHTVQNPDNTFNSNPDGIIIGLSAAIKKHFNVDFSNSWRALPDGFVLIGNQVCKYYQEINNVYIGHNFYVKNGKIIEINTDYQYVMCDGTILDMKARTIDNVSDNQKLVSMNNILKQNKINLIKNADKTKSLLVNKQPVLKTLDDEVCWLNLYNVDYINLQNFKQLQGDLHFSDVKKIYITCNDLRKVKSMNFNNVNNVIFTGNLEMNGTFDFSGVKNLDIFFLNLIGDAPTIKFNKYAESIKISTVYGLKGEIDFSNVKYLELEYVDLSGVNKLKLNPNGKIQMNQRTFDSARRLIQNLNKGNVTITR